MNWDTLKSDVMKFAPFLAEGLGVTGPLGALAGGILSAALGVPNHPDSITAAIAADPDAAAKIRLAEINNAAALQQAMIQNANEQVMLNNTMASKATWLIGWRALVGYDCAIALTWSWIVQPIADYFIKLYGGSVPPFELDTKTLLAVLSALLGLATWHGYEKWQQS